MAAIPCIDETHLQEICAVLGATDSGLKGGEIGSLLAQLGIKDELPTDTKRHRLFGALCNRQRADGCGNHVVAFIQKAMDPVRYVNSRETFDDRRHALNDVLLFSGYAIGEDGKLRLTESVKTLDEAEERANRLRTELRRRNVHPDVLKFCRAELVRNNYFHAVLEATKSVADKIRTRTGLQSDGAALVDHAFGLGAAGMPFLAFNSLQSETERSEHTGMMNLMKGMFSSFRNPTAHAPKIAWVITDQDAMDLLSLSSLLHRRIDGAFRTPRQ
jgi:uncharacterized protein (TIGR02391 family)